MQCASALGSQIQHDTSERWSKDGCGAYIFRSISLQMMKNKVSLESFFGVLRNLIRFETLFSAEINRASNDYYKCENNFKICGNM